MSAFESQPAPEPDERPSTDAPDHYGSNLRIGDAARQRVSRVLGQHLADGRLDMLEYEERLEQTLAARTQDDLVGVLDDLPALDADGQPLDPADPSIARQRAKAKSMLVGWLTLALFFTAIWAATDFGGYYWPIFPIMGTGLGVIPGAYAVWNGTADESEV